MDQQVVPTRVDQDRKLAESLRLREPTATEQLVATYGDRAYRLATRITGNEQDAEEVVQDAFWSVIRTIDTFQRGRRFRLLALPHRRERRLPEAARPAKQA